MKLKKIYFCFFLISIYSCKGVSNLSGIYILNRKPNNYNLILSINNNRYSLETFGTNVNSKTLGKIERRNHQVLLISDLEEPKYEKFGDSIFKVETFKPFKDTLILKKNGSKVYIHNSENKIKLYKKRPSANSGLKQ